MYCLTFDFLSQTHRLNYFPIVWIQISEIPILAYSGRSVIILRYANWTQFNNFQGGRVHHGKVPLCSPDASLAKELPYIIFCRNDGNDIVSNQIIPRSCIVLPYLQRKYFCSWVIPHFAHDLPCCTAISQFWRHEGTNWQTGNWFQMH